MIPLQSENFDREVASGTTMVCFWGAWCGACVSFLQVLETFESGYSGVRAARVNVDENRELAERHDVAILPTTVIYHDGKIIKKFVGVRHQEHLKKMMTKGEV